jgi:hypothetical protein
MDSTRDVGYYGDADLAEYLRRPVKILDQSWTVTSGSFQTAIDPWTLFLEDTNVRNRVEGYRLLQGNLHIRLAINGGPFFYGRAIGAYFPRQAYNGHSFGAVNGDYYKAQLSMLPHVFLDPTSSEGGEIVCPFLCPDNWIDLIGDTYGDMGRLHLQSINDLLHANSSTGTVNITAYAWMENVRLAAPTKNSYGTYAAHSGEEIAASAAGLSVAAAVLAWARTCHSKCAYSGDESPPGDIESPPMEAHAGDEYGTGIISKPASAVAKVAGMLANIPSIRPFARPTEVVASAVGRVAHVFGFSRPTIVSDIQRSKLKGAGNLANTDAHEAVAKLTLDSKQELTIDPRTVGLSDVDEMAFDYIKQKEMFVTTIEWSESDAGGAALGDLVVGPDFHLQETINSYVLNLLAPMYTVSAPFKFWRGSIKFRFQIAASQLHRGRMRISYDPYSHGGTSADENEVYSRIIDLATNRDFEMLVAWNHPQSWLRVNDRLGTSLYNHPGGTTSRSEDFHNGDIRLEVVNELTSPNPSLAQPVYINVFVSAGEDFEVACPTDDILSISEYEPQSGYEPHSGEEGEELIDEQDNIPESPAPVTSIGQEASLVDPNVHVFFGESFRSIRALLKRYCFHQVMGASMGAEFYWIESNFPVEPGQSVSPRHVTDAGATPASTPYNYTGMTYLNWFTPCYVGWRGGLRSKYMPSAFENSGYLMIRRFTEPVHQSDCGRYNYDTSTTNDDHLAAETLALHKGAAGQDVSYPLVDGAAEVEFPFYSNKRFAPGRRFLNGTGTSGNEWLGENAGHLGFYHSPSTPLITRYVAAGDDFSLFMWIGQPGIYARRTKPASGTSRTLPSY